MLLFLFLFHLQLADGATLSNDHVRLDLDAFGAPQLLATQPSGQNVLVDSAAMGASGCWWRVEVVVAGDKIGATRVVDHAGAKAAGIQPLVETPASGQLVLTWVNVPFPAATSAAAAVGGGGERSQTVRQRARRTLGILFYDRERGRRVEHGSGKSAFQMEKYFQSLSSWWRRGIGGYLCCECEWKCILP